MTIRKISIGADYKSSMHYLMGQEVLGARYIIHDIQYDADGQSYKIYVEKNKEVFLWKSFNSNMPVSVEYNMNF